MGKLERYIIGSVAAAIIIFLIWFFSNVVIYILVAAVISLLGKPLVDNLCKLKYKNILLPKWIAASIVILLIWGVLIFIISVFVPVIYDKVQTFAMTGVENFAIFINKPIGEIKYFLTEHFNYKMTLTAREIIEEIYTRLTSVVGSSVDSVASIIDFFSSAFIAVFSVTFIAFFFLKENKLFDDGVVLLFPHKFEQDIRDAINSSISLISKYLIGLIAESTIKTIFITLGLYIIGVDFGTSFIIAIITGVLNVIPYIGPIIGAAIGLFIALVSPHLQADLSSIIVQMTLLFLVFQLIDNIILQPYIYSNSVKAHPLEIFLVILIAGSLAGVWGMLLAIPAYTVLRVFAKIFFNKLMLVQKLTNQI